MASSRVHLYLKYLADGMSKKKAALKAGYSIATAKNAKHCIEATGSFQQALDQLGITDDVIASKLLEGINATKRYGDTEYPDYPTQHRFIELAIKIRGILSQRVVKPLPLQYMSNGRLSQEAIESINTEYMSWLETKFSRFSSK